MISVEFRLQHPLLHETLRAVPDQEVTWVRNVQAEEGRTMLIWTTDYDVDEFEDALAADPTVRLRKQIADDRQCLYQVEITDEGARTDLFPLLVDTASVVETATITADGWDCHFVFPDETALDEFFDTCRTRDIDFSIERIHRGYQLGTGETELTADQREALLTAVEAGYFDIPREADLAAIGDELGISDTAAGNRIRRGIKTLLRQSLR